MTLPAGYIKRALNRPREEMILTAEEMMTDPREGLPVTIVEKDKVRKGHTMFLFPAGVRRPKEL